jgi:hypothetical protein
MIKSKNNVFGNVIIDLTEDTKYIGNSSKMIFLADLFENINCH